MIGRLGPTTSTVLRRKLRDSAMKRSAINSTLGAEIKEFLNKNKSSTPNPSVTNYSQIERTGSEVDGFSPIYECKIFYRTFIPLAFAGFFEQSSDFIAVGMAGHTTNNVELLMILGISSMYFCFTVKFVIWGILRWMQITISSDTKKDIANDLRQGLVLGIMGLSPFLLLQFFAETIMRELFSVEESLAAEGGQYCCLMIITALLLLLDCSIEIVLLTLDHTFILPIMSILTSIFVYVPFVYVFLNKMNLGVKGFAVASIVHETSRLILWLFYLKFWNLINVVLVPLPKTSWTTETGRAEFLRYAGFGAIDELSMGALYELMIFVLWSIKGVPKTLLAAGTLWTQSMFLLKKLFKGASWAIFHRTTQLIWKRNPNGRTSWGINWMLSVISILFVNIVLLLCSREIYSLLSSDASVSDWCIFLHWTLALHVQTMMMQESSFTLFKAIGKGHIAVLVKFIACYIIAMPITLYFIYGHSLSIESKACICLSTGTIAHIITSPFGLAYTYRMDWDLFAADVITL